MKRYFIPVLVIVLTSFCQAECPIECYCDRVTTCTGDKLLTRFPLLDYHSPSLLTGGPGLPIIRVELHDYFVTHLSRQDFLRIISNLTEISISRNSLETFDNDTFSLHFTSSARGGGDGRPTSSDSSTFLQLRILDLSQNKLKYFVGGGMLRKVKILDLSSNMLQQVYELSAIQNLESVNLRDNRISYLEANIFQNLRNLQYVNLDSNVLGILDPSTFSNLPSLAHLILSSNPISSNLLPGFYWNSRVQFVDVSSTGLTKIPSSLTKTVRDFRCANNNLTVIRQTDFESYPNVGLLVLDENAIEVVEDDAFGRLDFLSRLWMNGNRLKRIPQNLPPSLRSLQLESNSIGNLTLGDFKNLRNLEELNLHGNRINSVQPLVFAELTSLKTLDLRSNLIDVIYRDSFVNLSSLETLDLSQNPIKVIVSGAFSAFRKLSLLHLSRWMEPIEFDVKGSFRPLQNLQILELDDSPHLTQKLFQDNAFSYMPNIIELNVQRCELEDVNLVSNALIDELPDLRSVKMNGNPWDCEDLHGSAIYELMSRLVVVDEPICAHPPSLKSVRLSSLNTSMSRASLNVLAEKKAANSDQQPPALPPLTRSGGDSLSSLSPGLHANSSVVTADQNTYSPGNGASGPSEILPTTSPTSNSSSNVVLMTKPRLSFSSKNSFPSVRVTSASSQPTSNPSARNGTQAPSAQTRHVTTLANSFADLIDDGGGGGDAVPTQSYFDSGSSTNEDDDVEGGDTSNRSGSVSGRQYKGTNSNPSSTNVIPMYQNGTTTRKGRQGRTRRPGVLVVARAKSSEETKTNDDNAIIDERSGRREQEQRSIDGFPLSYPDNDRVAKEDDAPSPSDRSTASSSLNNPKYSYLKLQDNTRAVQSRGDLPKDSASESHMTVIVKTLVISALTCLGSILTLFLISLYVYRYTVRRRTGRVVFPCARRSSNDEGDGEEDTRDTGRMTYTRFGSRKSRRDFSSYGGRGGGGGASSSSGNHRHLRPESDSDQVELSGITNSLYFENEDIYHIT